MNLAFVFLRKFWISILLCTAIFALCFMNTDPLPVAPLPDFDKLVHILMFMGLSGAIFFDNTCYLRQSIRKRRIFFGSFLLPVLIGGLIEIVQALTSYRTGDWGDFFSNAIGALIGSLICFLINRFLKPAING